jgi:hypothetical protein
MLTSAGSRIHGPLDGHGGDGSARGKAGRAASLRPAPSPASWRISPRAATVAAATRRPPESGASPSPSAGCDPDANLSRFAQVVRDVYTPQRLVPTALGVQPLGQMGEMGIELTPVSLLRDLIHSHRRSHCEGQQDWLHELNRSSRLGPARTAVDNALVFEWMRPGVQAGYAREHRVKCKTTLQHGGDRGASTTADAADAARTPAFCQAAEKQGNRRVPPTSIQAVAGAAHYRTWALRALQGDCCAHCGKGRDA